MKFIVKQAAPEAPAEKPVELSITLGDDGRAKIMANGSPILAFLPDGTTALYPLHVGDCRLGFVADSDSYIKIYGRKPI